MAYYSFFLAFLFLFLLLFTLSRGFLSTGFCFSIHAYLQRERHIFTSRDASPFAGFFSHHTLYPASLGDLIALARSSKADTCLAKRCRV